MCNGTASTGVGVILLLCSDDDGASGVNAGRALHGVYVAAPADTLLYDLDSDNAGSNDIECLRTFKRDRGTDVSLPIAVYVHYQK